MGVGRAAPSFTCLWARITSARSTRPCSAANTHWCTYKYPSFIWHIVWRWEECRYEREARGMRHIIYSPPREIYVQFVHIGARLQSVCWGAPARPHTHSSIFGPYDPVYKVHRGLLNSLMLQSLVPHQLGARTVCNISVVSSQNFKGLSHETYCAFIDINGQIYRPNNWPCRFYFFRCSY